MPSPHYMVKEPQREVYIKESFLRLHSASCLGTENMFRMNLNKSGYLLLLASGFKQVNHFFLFSSCDTFLFSDGA